MDENHTQDIANMIRMICLLRIREHCRDCVNDEHIVQDKTNYFADFHNHLNNR